MSEEPEKVEQKQTSVDRLSNHKLASALVATVISVTVSTGLILFSTLFLERYGWMLFVGVPIVVGFCPPVLYGCRERRSFRESLIVSLISFCFLPVVLLVFGIEGLLCLVMALPIALPLALAGTVLGHFLQATLHNKSLASMCVLLLVILSNPVLMGTEHAIDPAPPLLIVSTSITIEASPETVWGHVIGFSKLPEPEDGIFSTGISYPKRAEIHGKGVGAVRYCVFSTGTFVEPITAWEPPKLLKFSVRETPAPMKEWSPYDNLQPPHLHGFLVSKKGQFRLRHLPDGHTELVGTTWYINNVWPMDYWELWSDHIIHRIHERVLKHIKTQSEQERS